VLTAITDNNIKNTVADDLCFNINLSVSSVTGEKDMQFINNENMFVIGQKQTTGQLVHFHPQLAVAEK
jgi:hypothetical protein